MINNLKTLLFVGFAYLALNSCSEERVRLEKGAGFYEITKRELVNVDSLGNQTGTETFENYGYLTLIANSVGGSGTWILNGETYAFGLEGEYTGSWYVGPTDQNRFVMSKVFTVEGWGRKKVKLTYFHELRIRETFYLTRN